MTGINSYLTFNGNCQQAMEFYRSCLGGELLLQTVGESPLSDQMPDKMRGYILHSTLRSGSIVLMGSDMAPSKLVKGNAISLMLNCNSEEEARALYSRISEGGVATHPLETTFWGGLFGHLTDKFGHQWILNFNHNQDIK